MASDIYQVKYSDLYADGIVARSGDITEKDLVLLASTPDNGGTYISKITQVQDFRSKVLDTADVLKPGVQSLKLEYRSNTSPHRIVLVANGSVELGSVDCSDFIADGMLADVSYDESANQLVFTFNTAHPKQEPLRIDLSKLADSYDGDNITIKKSGNIFSCTGDMATVHLVSSTSAAVAADVSGLRTDYTGFKSSTINAVRDLSGQTRELSGGLSYVSSVVDQTSSGATGLIQELSNSLSGKLDVGADGSIGRELIFEEPVVVGNTVEFGLDVSARVMVTDRYGQIAFSGINSAQLDKISGLTADVQAQLDDIQRSAALSAGMLSGAIQLSVGNIQQAISQQVGDVETDFWAHANSRSNPHGVTAHQAGAYLCGETSSAVELSTKFNTISTYAQTKNQLSNDGYVTLAQLQNYIQNYIENSMTATIVRTES